MTDPVRKKILDKVDASKDHAIKFLQDMVAIPSVTGDEAAIQKHMHGYLTNIGLEVDMWETDWEQLKKHPGYRPVDRGYENRPNIVATLKGTGGGALAAAQRAHRRDSWSAMAKAGATIPGPHRSRTGASSGRGSCDMKSGVASHVLAVQYLKELGLTPKGDVMINIVIDEEVSGHGTLDTVIRGYKADAGISGETSDLFVQPAVHWSHLVPDRRRGQAGRHPATLSRHQRHRAWQQDRQGGAGARRRTRCDGQACALSERHRLRFPASSVASRLETIRAHSRPAPS